MTRKVAHCVYDAGQRVRDEINEQNVTVTDLATRAQIGRTTVYDFLYNGIDISSFRLARICGVLGISMDYVMGLSKNKGARNERVQSDFR